MKKFKVAKLVGILALTIVVFFACWEFQKGMSEARDREIRTIEQSKQETISQKELEQENHSPYEESTSAINEKETKYIECVVSHVECDPYFGDVSFDAWISDNGQYTYDRNWIVFNTDEKEELKPLNDAEDGDVFKFLVEVDDSGNFWSTDVVEAENTGEQVDVLQIENQYKNSLSVISCEELLRAPNDYQYQSFSMRGDVFQLISDDGSDIEFLLDTGEENGIVYIKYNREKDEPRILEHDTVKVYGEFGGLTRYNTIFGNEKIVPKLDADFLDLEG